jgi:hypothetical protein
MLLPVVVVGPAERPRHWDQVLARHGASYHRSPIKQGVLRAAGWALQFAGAPHS